jgi:nucleoside-triphosphatase THEP1
MIHKGKRLFITGIPTSGKSYLAKEIAEKVGGTAVFMDDFRKELSKDDKYRKWTDFYLNKNEKEYLTNTSDEQLWSNLVLQSEGLWPAFIAEINKYQEEIKPVIFECVNVMPHLAKKDFNFPLIVLTGSSFNETLERNKKNPRWGNTSELQELEAKVFWYVERDKYIDEANKYGYPVFENTNEALEYAIRSLT